MGKIIDQGEVWRLSFCCVSLALLVPLPKYEEVAAGVDGWGVTRSGTEWRVRCARSVSTGEKKGNGKSGEGAGKGNRDCGTGVLYMDGYLELFWRDTASQRRLGWGLGEAANRPEDWTEWPTSWVER